MQPRNAIPALGLIVVVIDGLFLGLAAISLIIRLWSRKIQGLRLALNDYAALLSLPLAAGLVTTGILGVYRGGTGQHLWKLNPVELTSALKFYFAAQLTWTASNTSIKVSIINFYLGIFGHNTRFRYSAYAALGLVICFGIGLAIDTLAFCRPISKSWEPLTPGTCGSNTKNILAASIINMVVDLLIIIMPLPMIWQLQMTIRRKIALTITFSLGVVVISVTIIRIVLAARLDPIDFTYNLAPLAIVTDLEPLLAIIIACAPLFPPVLRRTRALVRSMPSSIAARVRYGTSSVTEFNDEYPLTTLESVAMQKDVTVRGNKDVGQKEQRFVGYDRGIATVKTAIDRQGELR